MRVSVLGNFRILRWIGFLFLQNQKFHGGDGCAGPFVASTAREACADDAVITLRLVLQLQRVPCLPQ
jgi:hypothetical protein